MQHFVTRRRSFILLAGMDMRRSKWHAGQRASGNYLSVTAADPARSKTQVCGRSLAGIAGSIPACGISVSCDFCVLSGRVF